MFPQTRRLVRRFLPIGFGLVWSVAGAAQVADWFEPADSTLANAAHARSAGRSPAEATRGLLAAGVDPAQGVQAVIDTYAQCDAVFDAVAAASQIAPERASDLVQAAALNPRCPCGGENVWAASRLSNRVRLPQRSPVLEVLPSCGCVGAAAQAAAAALPERADQILAAALEVSRRASGIVDSIGQVGSHRGPLGAAGGGLMRREDDRCQTDTNPDDAFDPALLWQSGELALGELPSTRNSACRAAAQSEESDGQERDRQAGGVSIEAYQSGADRNALVLFNGGEHTVDLASENYQLELYFPGVKGPGRRLPLSGRVPPGGLFLVAGAGEDKALAERADLLLPSILLEPSEAVVLRRGLEDAGCGCAQLTVAGTLNGLGANADAWQQKQIEAGTIGNRIVADSVGQIEPNADVPSDWRSPLATVPLALSRAVDACLADTDIADAFVESDWQGNAAEAPLRCRQGSGTVLIASYRADREADTQPVWRVLDLWNDTGASIDLGEQGYLVEVYGKGEREPSRVIALSGTLATGGRFRVAADSAPSAIRDQADTVSADLAQEHIDALVLKRLSVRDHGQCDVDVYAALRELRAPVPLVPRSPREFPGGPRPDESVNDPNRGGEIASPN